MFWKIKGCFIFIVIFLLKTFSVFSQDGSPNNSESIHGNFQIDGQYYIEDSTIGAPKVPEKFLSNVFGNINYIKGDFSAGIRYEAYNNVRQGFDARYKGQGIVNRFARYKTDLLDITIGNIYEQFGSGIMLRTYYEPGLLYDNSLDGISVITNPKKGITLKCLAGKQRYFFEKGSGIVRGLDGEINLNELFDSILINKKTQIILGTSLVSKYQSDLDPNLILPENVATYGGRINLIREALNFSTEYAYKINDPSADNRYSYKSGEVLFSSLSYATKGLSFLLQLKRVDNMSYRSDRNESLQSLLINFLPATSKPHTYAMLALNPYATQLNGEIGFMGEIQYKIKKGTFFGGKYGTELTLNFSKVNGLNKIPVEDSLTAMTFYKTKYNEIGNKYYQDFSLEINKKISKEWKSTFVYSNQFYNRNVVQFGSENYGYENLVASICVLDISYKYKSTGSIRLELQGLFAKKQKMITNSNLIGKGDWATALLEWTPSGNWFFAIFDQYNYGNPESSSRIHYFLGTFGYNKNASRISISYGKQSAGVFCVGGVCRTVPASNGLTISITNSF